MQAHSRAVDIEPEFRAGLARIWQESRLRHLHSTDVVLAHLRQVIAGSQGSPHDAANAAHQLAGTLGIFGLPATAETAHALEMELGEDGPLSNARAHLLTCAAEGMRRDILEHQIIAD